MLQIKKRHSVIKGVTAGAVAFAIGLTGAAAFIGDDFQTDTQVYNREQPRSVSSDTTPTDTKKSDNKSAATGGETQAASTSGSTTQPAGSTSGSSFAPAPQTATNMLGSTAPTSPVSGGTSGGSGSTGGTSGSTDGGCLCSDIQDAAGTILNSTDVDASTPVTQTQLPSF